MKLLIALIDLITLNLDLGHWDLSFGFAQDGEPVEPFRNYKPCLPAGRLEIRNWSDQGERP
jgi:hypothetical protein